MSLEQAESNVVEFPSSKPAKKSKARRANGEGNIYQREEDGLWVARISVGKGDDGRRKRRVVYGKTRAEVVEKKKKLEAEVEAGVVSVVRDTVGSVIDDWLNTVRADIRPRSFENYSFIADTYIRPHFGEMVVSKVTPAMVKDWLSKNLKRETPRLDQPAGSLLSATTRRHCYVNLLRIFEHARRPLRLIMVNPVEEVLPPANARKKMSVWTLAQAEKFLSAPVVMEHRLFALFKMVLRTGMRIGELTALNRADIDFENSKVKVQHTLLEMKELDESGKPTGHTVRTREDPKSEAGERAVSLDPDDLATLKAHFARMDAEGQRSEFVFVTRKGRPYGRRAVLRMLYRVQKLADVPQIRMHDGRHTNATLLIAAKVDAKTVSTRIGHASVAFTMDTYVKPVEEQDREAAAIMGKLLGGAR